MPNRTIDYRHFTHYLLPTTSYLKAIDKRYKTLSCHQWLGGAEYGFTVEELIARLEPEEIVYYLNPGDLKEFSAAINARIRGIPTFRYNYIDQAELGDLYFLSRSLISRLSQAKKMSLLVKSIEDEEDLNQLLLLVSNKVVRNSRKLKQDLIAVGKE